MEVFKSRTFSDFNGGSVAAAIGNFDGLHRGHQAVINKAVKIARQNGIKSGVYTFKPHPLKVVKHEVTPSSILSQEQKIKLIDKMGVDYYFQQKFTSEFANISYKDFVKYYLIKRVKVKYIVVGENFKLGKNGEGSVEALSELGKKYDFQVRGIKSVLLNGERISSTVIRREIKEGKIKNIKNYLGRLYRINGKVIKGRGVGHKIGVPTANIDLLTNYALPPCGVYACFVYIGAKRYKGIVNFGYKPTFSEKKFSIEVHIIDFDYKNIYGKTIGVELAEFIRKEITFDSSEDLVKQINKDILYTDNLLC